MSLTWAGEVATRAGESHAKAESAIILRAAPVVPACTLVGQRSAGVPTVAYGRQENTQLDLRPAIARLATPDSSSNPVRESSR